MSQLNEPAFLQGVVVAFLLLGAGHLLIGVIDAIGRVADRVTRAREESRHG